jgi:hypothetical protein
MNSGATAAVRSTLRRESDNLFMAIESVQAGRDAEYKRRSGRTVFD